MSERQKVNQLVTELLKEAGYTRETKPNIDYKWRMPGHQQVQKSAQHRRERHARRELMKNQPLRNYANLDKIRYNYHQLVKERGAERGLTDDQIQQTIRETEAEFMAQAIERIFGHKRYGAKEAFRE